MSITVSAEAYVPQGSVSECLDRVRLGDSIAQQRLWKRFFCRLVQLARCKLGPVPDVVEEPEDIASTVFHDFFVGVGAGRFEKLENREDLWQILSMLTSRRSIDHRRKSAAKKRSVLSRRRWSVTVAPAVRDDDTCVELSDAAPNPAQLAILREELKVRLQQLGDERLTRIAVARLNGYGNHEIADQLGCSLRSVERKLQIIRRRWLDA